jgi:membrane-bound lytic murein transglycosylase B
MYIRLFVLLLFTIGYLSAAAPARALALNEYPELGAFIDEVSEKHGFSAKALRQIFSQAKLRTDILEVIERPREALPWYEYKKSFLTELHVRRGVDYWKRHAATFERVREQYGVPPEIIVAVLGVETQYGRNTGRYRVIDALTTLTVGYPRRSEFFRRELEEYLLLTRDLGLDPTQVQGSYAGAIGIPQFLSSSYRRYAVDFDGDSKADLLSSAADAIASVANFLKRHGWEANEPVTDDVQLEGALYTWIEQLGVKPVLSIRHLIQYGVFPRGAEQPHDRSAALIVLEGESGPIYRIGYNNFYVITRYNRSKRYAMAVYELAQSIRTRYEEEP